tara:strand:- start:247 stop:417 length:171 start_codon:yes stop_codon:yes gene_type:complete
MKYTDKHIAEACAKYVDTWDMETLIGFAQEQMFIRLTEQTYATEFHEFMGEWGSNQ